ncbi:MAG: hypothetical protein ACYDA0_14015 [Candidatus Dormibacteraceae bacterium]
MPQASSEVTGSLRSPVMDEASRPLKGEDIGTSPWEDARQWTSIYADLLEFRRGILDRVRRDLSKLEPVVQRAAKADLKIIESQMEAYQTRLELWSRRV